MAATSRTETYDAAWTATAAAKRDRKTDNIFDATPTLDRMRRAGALEVEPGGKEFREDVIYSGPTAEWFSGDDPLNTDSFDGITAAHFSVCYLANRVKINFTEEQENKGKAQIFSLMEAKQMQSNMGLTNALNAAIYSAKSGKSILGRQDIQATAPTTGTIGGINRANEAWWRNQTNASGGNFNGTSGDFYTGFTSMGAMYDLCSEGNIEPTNIWTTLTLYGEYEQILESTGYARIVNSDSSQVDGSKPRFRKAVVNYDRDCGSGLMYFDNYKYLKFKVLSGVNFAKTPFQQGTNQLAKVAFNVVGCNVVTNNPRRLGVISFT